MTLLLLLGALVLLDLAALRWGVDTRDRGPAAAPIMELWQVGRAHRDDHRSVIGVRRGEPR